MKIVIFGANSKVGKKIIAMGLRHGHLITAFVRNPDKLQMWDDNLKAIKGDTLNYEDVEKAVAGQDLVINTISNKTLLSSKVTRSVYSSSIKNIVTAMRKNNISRLISITFCNTAGYIMSFNRLITKPLWRRLFIDISRHEDIIKASNLNWTIIRPTRLVNVPKTGKYRVGSDIKIKAFSKISRADLADFIIKNIDNKEIISRSVLISH